MMGLLTLVALSLSALSGVLVWVALNTGWTSTVLPIAMHAYVGLAGTVVVAVKMVVGVQAWRRRAQLRPRPGDRRQHVLTAILVVVMVVLYGSGTLLCLNVTPGGGALYKGLHFYSALAGVPVVTAHLVLHLSRAWSVVSRTVTQASEGTRQLSRRRLLAVAVVALAAWVASRTVTTTATSLDVGIANDFPVTLTAGGSDQPSVATWTLNIDGDVAAPLRLTAAQLHAEAQIQHRFSLDCITGWSAVRTWGGVSLGELLARAEPTGEVLSVVVASTTGYSVALVPAQLNDPRTLVAHRADGVDLSSEHGYPARMMVPDVIGEKCVKWVDTITVVCA